jgi:hypothetical protein
MPPQISALVLLWVSSCRRSLTLSRWCADGSEEREQEHIAKEKETAEAWNKPKSRTPAPMDTVKSSALAAKEADPIVLEAKTEIISHTRKPPSEESNRP